MSRIKDFKHLTRVLSVCSLIAFISLPAVAQTNVQDEDVLYMEGLKEYNIGSVEKALTIFSSLARKGSMNDAVYFYLSNIYLYKNQLDSAQSLMEKAVKLDPSNTWYSTQLASVYLHNQQTDKAVGVYEALRKSHPQQVELFDGLIDIYINQKKSDEAFKVLEEIEKYSGKNEATSLTRYNLFIYQNKRDEATKFLTEFDKEEGTPRTSTILGDYHSSLKEDSLAMEYYNKALSMEPSYVPALFGQAELHRVKSRFDLYFRSMIPFMANPVVAPDMKVEYLTQIITNQRFVETFLPQVDTLVSNMYTAHPGDSSVAYLYSRYMAQTGRPENAATALKENLKYYGDSRDAQKEYLSLLYYMEDWKTIISHISTFSLKFANDPGLLEIKGIAYAQQEMVPEAIKVYKDVLYIAAGDSAMEVRALSVLGDLSYQVGNRKEAYKYYKRSLQKAPNYNPVLNNYAYYLSLEGKQLEKAYQMSKKTIDTEPDNPTYLDTFAWILHLMGKDVEAKAIIKHALIYGGNESAAILDHYADILYALKENDLAFRYWEKADNLDPTIGIAEKAAKIKGEKK